MLTRALPCLLLPVVAAMQQPAAPASPRTPVRVLDCNRNGVADVLDLASGASQDCDGNAVPDECDTGRVLVLRESFELGLSAGWSATGIAHVTDQCARPSVCDGSRFAYFGNDRSCTFEGGTNPSGVLTAHAVELPVAGAIEMSFCSAYEGEGDADFDQASIRINDMWLQTFAPDPQYDWAVWTVDLTAFAGQTVDIGFRFEAQDQVDNDYLGWQVDNVQVFAFATEGGGPDCNANGIPDVCEIDCDLNGVPDECDLAQGPEDDCNQNGVPDKCDVTTGFSGDCNLNLVPDECDLMIDLVSTELSLEAGASTILSLFTYPYYFSGGEAGACIPSASLDMYDCGNILNTDHATAIPYTGSALAGAGAFGTGSTYFTAKYPGVFVMAATGCSMDAFWIGGGGGTGSTSVLAYTRSIDVDGEPYTVYVKCHHGGIAAPSVNQLVIVPGDGSGITHSPGNFLEDHTLSGLSDVDHLLYLLVSRYDDEVFLEGDPVLPPQAQAIAREVVQNVVWPSSADADDDGVPDECD